MKKIFRKRQIIITALVVALGAAIFVNWYATKPKKESNAANLGDAQYVNADVKETENPQQEYFSEATVKRSQAHAEAQSLLENVIKDSASDEQSKKAATDSLAKLSDSIKKEADLENIIKAKINSACLVVLDESSANVILSKGTLNDTVAMQIKEMVLAQTNLNSENIIILEAK